MERHHILHTADNNTFCWQTSRLMQIARSLAYMQAMHEHENELKLGNTTYIQEDNSTW